MQPANYSVLSTLEANYVSVLLSISNNGIKPYFIDLERLLLTFSIARNNSCANVMQEQGIISACSIYTEIIAFIANTVLIVPDVQWRNKYKFNVSFKLYAEVQLQLLIKLPNRDIIFFMQIKNTLQVCCNDVVYHFRL
ncbi:hypothetical protein BDF20DRAFT_990021 [Mycotypha africana]|uniref:uncharacterized protein n=1 Tax=Mycotypha africana TaxID=64632 RepID=UPI002301CD91|nr:uncharacterized protein BDF20DRAFT_990021 [Mycotypha africana]KAI8971773.1 hypothetical protein BDF20DRAFT_990021 [Mycotypha africana]